MNLKKFFFLNKILKHLLNYFVKIILFPNIVFKSLIKNETHIIDFYIKRFLLKGVGFYQYKTTISKECAKKVNALAKQTIGLLHEEYSGATAPEIAFGFENCIIDLKNKFEKVNYLEIGSAKGKSMSLIGLLSIAHNLKFEGISIDPYFEEGYFEGSDQPERFLGRRKKYLAPIKSSNLIEALNLWRKFNLSVKQIRETSLEGLKKLELQKLSFNLIYIDGLHDGLTPIFDFNESLKLIKDKGIIILDDRHWANVHYLRKICDNTLALNKIYENWKISCYQIDKSLLKI